MSFQDKRLHRLSLYTKTNALVGSQGICLLGGRFRLVCPTCRKQALTVKSIYYEKHIRTTRQLAKRFTRTTYFVSHSVTFFSMRAAMSSVFSFTKVSPVMCS